MPNMFPAMLATSCLQNQSAEPESFFRHLDIALFEKPTYWSCPAYWTGIHFPASRYYPVWKTNILSHSIHWTGLLISGKASNTPTEKLANLKNSTCPQVTHRLTANQYAKMPAQRSIPGRKLPTSKNFLLCHVRQYLNVIGPSTKICSLCYLCVFCLIFGCAGRSGQLWNCFLFHWEVRKDLISLRSISSYPEVTKWEDVRKRVI